MNSLNFFRTYWGPHGSNKIDNAKWPIKYSRVGHHPHPQHPTTITWRLKCISISLVPWSFTLKTRKAVWIMNTNVWDLSEIRIFFSHRFKTEPTLFNIHLHQCLHCRHRPEAHNTHTACLHVLLSSGERTTITITYILCIYTMRILYSLIYLYIIHMCNHYSTFIVVHI